MFLDAHTSVFCSVRQLIRVGETKSKNVCVYVFGTADQHVSRQNEYQREARPSI